MRQVTRGIAAHRAGRDSEFAAPIEESYDDVHVSRAGHRWSAVLGLSVAALAQVTPIGAPSMQAADSLFAAKDYARAMAAYESLARHDENNARLWYQLGMTAANLGSYDRGASAFARAAALAPSPNAAYNAAAMHARLNHPDSAFAWLDRAVKLGFQNAGLLQTDDDMASLRSDRRYASVVAAVASAKPPAPCLTDSNSRRFDFWVGDWNVTTQGGAPVGRSSVQSVSGGCALLENWTAGNGGTGKSLNAYNAGTKQLVQFWVGQGARSLTTLRASGTPAPSPSCLSKRSERRVQRLTFTPLNDSTVSPVRRDSTSTAARRGGSTRLLLSPPRCLSSSGNNNCRQILDVAAALRSSESHSFEGVVTRQSDAVTSKSPARAPGTTVNPAASVSVQPSPDAVPVRGFDAEVARGHVHGRAIA